MKMNRNKIVINLSLVMSILLLIAGYIVSDNLTDYLFIMKNGTISAIYIILHSISAIAILSIAFLLINKTININENEIVSNKINIILKLLMITEFLLCSASFIIGAIFSVIILSSFIVQFYLNNLFVLINLAIYSTYFLMMSAYIANKHKYVMYLYIY